MKKNLSRYILLTFLFFTLQPRPLSSLAAHDLQAGYTLGWWTVDAGGGTSSGGGYALSGALGQGDAGSLLGGSYLLKSGFWAGLWAAFEKIHLPLLTQNYIHYFEGNFEVEPNSTADQANGLLRSAQAYQGYPNDTNDFFSLQSSTAGTITINLADHTGSGVQLVLYYQTATPENRLAVDNTPPYQINQANAKAGKYYVQIYTLSGFNTSKAYSLTATYP